jgi:hypothetical protein
MERAFLLWLWQQVLQIRATSRGRSSGSLELHHASGIRIALKVEADVRGSCVVVPTLWSNRLPVHRANVNDEVVEGLRCSCIHAHLQELIQVRRRYARDRHSQ